MINFNFYKRIKNFQLCQLNDVVYQLKWYNYPTCYQKYLLMIMVRTQPFKPISGLGLTQCSLNKFAVVKLKNENALI